MDLFLDGLILKDEYRPRKEKLLSEKKDLQEILRDFAAGGDNWFERAKEFVTTLNKGSYIIREGNLESQKEFLKKIGSNFIFPPKPYFYTIYGGSATNSLWSGVGGKRAPIKFFDGGYPPLLLKRRPIFLLVDLRRIELLTPSMPY